MNVTRVFFFCMVIATATGCNTLDQSEWKNPVRPEFPKHTIVQNDRAKKSEAARESEMKKSGFIESESNKQLAILSPEPPMGKEPDGPPSDQTTSNLPLQKDNHQNTLNQTTPSQSDILFDVAPDKRAELLGSLLQGAYHRERKEFEKASDAYSNALSVIPESPTVMAIAAQTLLESGHINQAIEDAEAVLLRDPNEIIAYQVLGQAYAQQKQWERALFHYEKLLEKDPDNLNVLNNTAMLYLRLQRSDDALKTFQHLAKVDRSQEIIYRFRAGILLTQLGRLDEALAEFKTIEKREPAFVETYLRMGQIQEQLGQNDDALETYLNALSYKRNQNDELNIRKRLGNLYHLRGSLWEASHQYAQIKKLKPNDLETIRTLAILYYDQQRYDKALVEFNYLLLSDQGNFRLAVTKRNILQKLGKEADGYRSFLESFDYAVQNRQKQQLSFFLLETFFQEELVVYQTLMHLTTLKQLLDSTQTAFPDMPRIRFSETRLAIFQDDKAIVKKNLLEIINAITSAQNQNNETKLNQVVMELRSWPKIRYAFSDYGLHEDVVEALSVALSTSANPEILHWTLGMLSVDQWKWEESENHLTLAIEKIEAGSPAYKSILFLLASIYDKQNRLVDVESMMHQAIELYPDDAQPYNFLGYAYAERNVKLDDALQLIEKAIRLQPEDGNIIDSIGWVYFRLGRVQEALSYLQHALELQQNHPVILNHLGDVYHQSGQSQNAVDFWKKALHYGPEEPFEFTPEFKATLEAKIRNN